MYYNNNKDNKNRCPRCGGEMTILFQHDLYCKYCEPFVPSEKEDKPKKRIVAESDHKDPYGFSIIELDELDLDDDRTDPDIKPWKP